MDENTVRRLGNLNVLEDDPDWCGHGLVSLRTWACADCDRPVNSVTRSRMEQRSPLAPAGSLWVLERAEIDDLGEEGDRVFWGIFTDRRRICRIMVRDLLTSAAHIRDCLRRTHWYQGVFNMDLFEGWEEELDERGQCFSYRLYLQKIDSA